jgi:excisionase family DNA binding protein
LSELTVPEVAARLQVTAMTVRRWLSAGSLIGLNCENRAECRIRESDLATFLDARRRGGVQERAMRSSSPEMSS